MAVPGDQILCCRVMQHAKFEFVVRFVFYCAVCDDIEAIMVETQKLLAFSVEMRTVQLFVNVSGR